MLLPFSYPSLHILITADLYRVLDSTSGGLVAHVTVYEYTERKQCLLVSVFEDEASL